MQLFLYIASLGFFIFSVEDNESLINKNQYVSGKDSITYSQDDFDLLLTKAQLRKDVIVLIAGSVDCEPCAKFVQNLGENKSLIKTLNSSFVSFRFDRSDSTQWQLRKRYKLDQLPAVLFLDSHGQVLARILGKSTSKKVLQIAKKIKRKYIQE